MGQTQAFSGFSRNIWLGSSPGSAGPHKDITALCISHSCCVLRVIVLLEGEHSGPAWGSECFWTGFSLRLYVGALELFLYSDGSLPLKNRPTARGCYQHTSLLGCTLHVMSRACFPSNRMLGLRFIRPDNIFSQCEGPLGAFLLILNVFSRVFTEERIESCHTNIKPRSVECCSGVCPIQSWTTTRVTIRFLVTRSNKSPSPSIAQFGQEASSKKNPGCCKLLPLGRGVKLSSWRAAALQSLAPTLLQHTNHVVFSIGIRSRNSRCLFCVAYECSNQSTEKTQGPLSCMKFVKKLTEKHRKKWLVNLRLRREERSDNAHVCKWLRYI